MITTGCEGCCFLQENDGSKGCAAQQLCCLKDDKVLAPGYCRTCRSHRWAKRQKTTDLSALYKAVVEERALKFDMLLFFDEATNTVADLERTLNSDWYIRYAQKIIIMDVTGFGGRKNLALQYLKSREHPVPTVVDSSAVHESIHQREETIRRLSKQVTAPFFMAIPAGNAVKNFDVFAAMIQHVTSRVIHWSFPFSIGGTTLVQQQLHYGLFITAPYRALMKSPEAEPFTQQLRQEERETEMGLSWFCSDCWLV
ncbi:MAG: hypothetical protein DRJ03_00345 [Chloroflexi bacterium]|nr:MAG: hypothetical protein DRJ03_00345 [Chloroflexota bacterium]